MHRWLFRNTRPGLAIAGAMAPAALPLVSAQAIEVKKMTREAPPADDILTAPTLQMGGPRPAEQMALSLKHADLRTLSPVWTLILDLYPKFRISAIYLNGRLVSTATYENPKGQLRIRLPKGPALRYDEGVYRHCQFGDRQGLRLVLRHLSLSRHPAETGDRTHRRQPELHWQTPDDLPFPMPVDVMVDDKVITVPMTNNQREIAVPAGTTVIPDIHSKILQQSDAVDRYQKYQDDLKAKAQGKEGN